VPGVGAVTAVNLRTEVRSVQRADLLIEHSRNGSDCCRHLQMPKRTEQCKLPANEATEIERVAVLLGGYRGCVIASFTDSTFTSFLTGAYRAPP